MVSREQRTGRNMQLSLRGPHPDPHSYPHPHFYPEPDPHPHPHCHPHPHPKPLILTLSITLTLTHTLTLRYNINGSSMEASWQDLMEQKSAIVAAMTRSKNLRHVILMSFVYYEGLV
jgi:hypothetical protein